MNLGDFRRLTADFPDDYEIVANAGDAVWFEVDAGAGDVLVPALGAPGVVILNGGQEVTEQHVIPYRLDLDEWVELEWQYVPRDWEIYIGDIEEYGILPEYWKSIADVDTSDIEPGDWIVVRRST